MKQKKRAGKISTIVGILVCLIFIPIILVNIVMIVKTYTDSSHIPGVFGIKPVIVLSGSMSPAFETESLIFVKETDTSTLKEGDIICYFTDGAAVTHRIDSISEENGEKVFLTKGDANDTVDEQPVLMEEVEGKYIGQIAGLGGFAIFMQSTTGMIIFIVVPVILYLAWDIWGRMRETKAEKRRADELEAQIAALQEEKLKREQGDKTGV